VLVSLQTADGYGEHAKMAHPFDGTGIGRLWPLLTGERAHYELAAGRAKEGEAAAGSTLERLTHRPEFSDPRASMGRR
jgi:glucoamylase